MKVELKIDGKAIGKAIGKAFIKKLCISIAIITAFTFAALYLNNREKEERERVRKLETFMSEQRGEWYEMNTTKR